MTLRFKLNLVLLTLLLTTLTAGLTTFYVVGVSSQKSNRVTRLHAQLGGIDDVWASLLRWVQLASLPDFADHSERIAELRGSIEERQKIMVRTASTDHERSELTRSQEDCQRLFALTQAMALPAEAQANPEATGILDTLERRFDLLRRDHETELYAAQSESAMAGFYAKVVAGILCCVIILPAGWLILLTRRSLIEPIQTLVEATRRIGQGRLDHQVHLPGRDELSQLAQQVNEMASRLSDHQERLMRSRELAAIGEICAGVAHGMRNPLAGIRTSAQVLSRRLTDLPEEQQRIAELIREIDRLEARIASLLDFARPTTLNRRSVSVGSLVDAAIRDTKSTLRETGAEVTASDTTRDVQIDVDVDQMTQVLAELFSNAIEHMPGGGRITVTATSSRHNGNPNGTTLSVSDTGTGIRPNGLAHVFDLFFTTRPGGTGVGLAGAKRVVEAHGGRISVSSEPEAGTTVHICF